MKELTFPHRTHRVEAGVYSNGLHKELVTVHAPTPYAAELAAIRYRDMTREGMDTGARIDRALHLHATFDAEARHNIVEVA